MAQKPQAKSGPQASLSQPVPSQTVTPQFLGHLQITHNLQVTRKPTHLGQVPCALLMGHSCAGFEDRLGWGGLNPGRARYPASLVGGMINCAPSVYAVLSCPSNEAILPSRGRLLPPSGRRRKSSLPPPRSANRLSRAAAGSGNACAPQRLLHVPPRRGRPGVWRLLLTPGPPGQLPPTLRIRRIGDRKWHPLTGHVGGRGLCPSDAEGPRVWARERGGSPFWETRPHRSSGNLAVSCGCHKKT